MRNSKKTLRGLPLLAGVLSLLLGSLQPASLHAQFPPAGSPPPVGPPPAPVGPSATLGQGIGPYDFYSTAPNAYNPPSLLNAPPPATGFGGPPPGSFPGSPSAVFPQPPPGQFSQPYYGPGQPLPGTGSGIFGPGSVFGAPPSGPYLKFFQQVMLTFTWIDGDGGADVDINDVETALTAAFPNFLWGTQPLLVTPGFVFHFWEGPAGISADLPPRAYSGYLDAAWQPQITPQLGAELGLRAGIYSDFQRFVSDSLRFQGRALFVLRLSSTVTVRAGVVYLDRVDIKLLPAGGILWMPNPQTKFDIFFPRPKLSRYLTTVGTAEIWGYVAGELGGGSWTIERVGGAGDRIDLNDFRIMGGFECSRPGGLKMFFELGYVFEREVIYDVVPADNFKPPDTVMLRGGLAF